ncbi:MAG: hypothetical protein ACO2PN_23550 [Pyrobaculum sp.]|jgi:hypothetical protein
MSYRELLVELADRVLELSRAVASRQGAVGVEVFEGSRRWIRRRVRKLPRPRLVWFLDGVYRTTTLDGFRSVMRWSEVDRGGVGDYAWRFKYYAYSVFSVNAVGFVVDLSDRECINSYNILFPRRYDSLVYDPRSGVVMSVNKARRRCGYRMVDYVLVV